MRNLADNRIEAASNQYSNPLVHNSRARPLSFDVDAYPHCFKNTTPTPSDCHILLI